jgi:hypothetical protein
MEEADQVSAAYHVALARLGVATVEEALALWNGMPTTSRAVTAAGWLRRAITLVMGRRRMSRDLARAYYRLARALLTGSTVADPYHPEPAYVTLDDLRREFAMLAGTSPQPSRAKRETGAPAEQAVEPDEPTPDTNRDEDAEADRALVEELEGLREEEERLEREAEEELRLVLEALGPANLDHKLGQIDNTSPADEVDELREDAHAQAGARQAAAAARVAMNGARSAVWAHAERDRRALGYVRISLTGSPCGWCAMLIGRGAVYRSERSAEYADGDKYHDNCQCAALPVFTRAQYRDSALFEVNRAYEQLWPQVTKGLSGKAAVTAWRRYIRQTQRAAAQEARQPTTTAQEA